MPRWLGVSGSGAEEFGGQKVPEAHLHDERVLPHQVLGNLEATFPRAIAGEEELEEPERPDALEERGRSIGQLPRAASLGGRARGPRSL